ncbi:small nuclear ribonucleoprotein Sm D3 [Thecamonas trahens ATCC 50062]|uniref:Small nuclear ribonucleoprotein Sm D3 n=1 Tax=Thecamonas trahens ATCC 50062 TaxID=461836 RepID=A0A0L0DA44_THETB|nr:small nuclear ribonucleoprotein Sm D3 [Thecamonas trahens ATCC 50062]KNC49095.1 small nuclear ribonucleoprotein Sm D3 [Thecamonas trahens ATCC 50062]|eukprot:XP_013758124.1 small nuclear ribonucleoprotein Sm D3 [Thecamonas trahens ATCC 50062]
MASHGVPIKLLHEAEGHKVTLETKAGDVYRGLLDEADDSMNVFLKEVVKRAKDGSKSSLGSAFIRGSQVRYVILPSILTHAPMLRRMDKANNIGLGISQPPSARQ